MPGPVVSEEAPLSRLGTMFRWLPALVVALVCLHVVELAVGRASGAVLLLALRNELAGLLGHAWLPVVLALPWLFLGTPRARLLAVGATWSVLLLVYALLIEYHASTGVPLGADLFAYSFKEVSTTVSGASLRLSGILALVAALVLLWWSMLSLARERMPGNGAILILLLLPLGMWLAPVQGNANGVQSTLAFNKGAFFVDQTLRAMRGGEAQSDTGQPVQAVAMLDKDHPFLHAEHTPDTLGPLLAAPSGTPPNFVFIVVEGLGRTYSGPGARLGSFTPFLDELSKRSLYFENFLAPQGRTFAVLPSIFGSLPFGANGYSALGKGMPQYLSLPATLKQHGYQTRFYTGANLEFDNQGLFLQRSGVDALVSERDFPPGLRRSSEWGYADRQLVDLVLAREAGRKQPFATIIQTNTMHMPFAFPGRERYQAKVGERLAALQIPADQRGQYTRQSEVYASILYTDDALRLYFESVQQQPWYANTIFVITGDHRMPEIAADTRLERYHVPLIVFSPLLKAPVSIKSVSSHFDITPSLLAYLASNHGIKTPGKVTWMGTGLDVEPTFRNVHVLPIKQTKTELSDFVSGTSYLGQDQLYTITDGMQIEPVDSPGGRENVRRQFGEFTAANNVLIKSGSLMPKGKDGEVLAYEHEHRSLVRAQTASQASALSVSGMRVSGAPGGPKQVVARFANRDPKATPEFVPLMVVTDDKGRELREVYGKATKLPASGALEIELALPVLKLAPGKYFLSVIPSHPDNGKPVGAGQYHVGFEP